MKLTSKEVALAVALAFMGLVFSTRTFLIWLNTLNAFEGIVVYYAVLYVALFVLGKLDLVVFGVKIKDPLQTFGLAIITFAFFITVNWTNPYVQYATTGSFQGASNVFTNNSEDGVTWAFWSWLLPYADIMLLRILAFVVTPFVLALIGGLFVSKKVKLGR